MTERVTTAVESGVAEVCLNRPDKHNALDLALFEAIRAAGAALCQRNDVRAVVLHGNGPSFCSGLDYPSFLAAGTDIEQALMGDGDGSANNAQLSALIWRQVPVPVICALHGAVFGGGLQIAAAADIRIAAPAAQLSIMEVKWGLIPDMGLSVSLAGQINVDVLKELSFTGRVVSGEEAAQLGLVTRTHDDPLAAARELAADIAEKSPDAVRAGKKLYTSVWGPDPAMALPLEALLQRRVLRASNQAEAVAAAQEQRAPRFADPD